LYHSFMILTVFLQFKNKIKKEEESNYE